MFSSGAALSKHCASGCPGLAVNEICAQKAAYKMAAIGTPRSKVGRTWIFEVRFSVESNNLTSANEDQDVSGLFRGCFRAKVHAL